MQSAAFGDARDRMEDAPVGDHHVSAGRRCDARGLDLGAHAAARQFGRRAAGHRLDLGRHALDDRQQSRLRVAVRRRIVKPGDVGEQDQEVRARHGGDPRREAIIVAVADLAGRDRVVLVDDRDCAHGEETAERRARVEIAAALLRVLQGQQDLARDDAVSAERARPFAGERDLSDRRGRLAVLELERSLWAARRPCGRARSRRRTRRSRSRRARGERRCRTTSASSHARLTAPRRRRPAAMSRL